MRVGIFLLLAASVVVDGDEAITGDCRLCPTGIDPPNEDASAFDLGAPLGLTAITCGTLDGILAVLQSDTVACSIVQSTFGVETCFCPPSDDETCTLCPEGESPADDLLDSIPVDLSNFGLPDISCQNLVDDGDELDCNFVDLLGQACGCADPNATATEDDDDDFFLLDDVFIVDDIVIEDDDAIEETCTLCEPGDRPADVTDLFPIDLSFFELPDLSCNQLFEEGEIDCAIVDVARPLCGCGVFTDEEEEETCTLCEEGDRPAELADLVPLPFADLFLPEVSCSQLFDGGDIECALVDIARPLCGCGVLADDSCTLCEEGDRPATVSDVIRIDLSQFGLPELSCKQLFDQGEINCDIAALARPLCGCGVFDDNVEVCSLCEEGDRPADVADLVQVDLSQFGIPELSCNRLWENGEVDCEIVDIARPLCGCGVFSDEKCSLCEEGNRPAQVQDLVDLSDLGLPELSCNQLFQEGEIDCSIVDIARPLCGCGVFEGEPDPEPIELCPLCDEDQLPLPSLADVVPFDLGIFDLEQLTCSELFGDGNPDLPCPVAEIAGSLCGCGFFQNEDPDDGEQNQFCRDSRPRQRFPIRKKLRGPDAEEMTCGKLAVQATLEQFAGAVGGEVDFFCSNFPRVRNRCRLTCRNCRANQVCEDDVELTFPEWGFQKKNCRSLARISSSARRNRICRQNLVARVFCPVTCGECVG